VKGFGPLLVSMDSHGNSSYARVAKTAEARRAAALAAMGVKA
ncbi:MAG: fumarate hydrolyase, partial [Alphaproteobacteria bacterium]|nr:fumarate hydrolyase [Alphaproteobacteria bacterium]